MIANSISIMQESLEQLVEEQKLKPTLLSEINEQIKNYPANWKYYMKGLIVPLLASTGGAALGPKVAHALGYTSEFASIACSYVTGYTCGYTTAFGIEYLRNKEKYKKLFSKEFGKFVATFIAADYVADISVFQTTMLASNFLLKEHADMADGIRKATSWMIGGFCWISAMAGLHPVSRRINDYLNSSFKKLHHKIADKKDHVSPI
jgi:hypothetical protein